MFYCAIKGDNVLYQHDGHRLSSNAGYLYETFRLALNFTSNHLGEILFIPSFWIFFKKQDKVLICKVTELLELLLILLFMCSNIASS
jgi:hypothetical protein